MNSYDVVICESAGRWAASLRTAIGRSGHTLNAVRRMHETRSLLEFTATIAAIPRALALIEVRPANIHDVLTQMAESRLRCPHVRFVALLALEELTTSQVQLVSDTLRAAGAVEILDSSRNMTPVLCIGERMADSDRPTAASEDSSLVGQAWSLLPWQDARRPIG